MANVEVNRRAEGTSELNRRLGDGSKGDWAFARCGVAGDYGGGLAGKQAAPTEREGVERQKSIRSSGIRHLIKL